jgi:hypothetical protein
VGSACCHFSESKDDDGFARLPHGPHGPGMRQASVTALTVLKSAMTREEFKRLLAEYGTLEGGPEAFAGDVVCLDDEGTDRGILPSFLDGSKGRKYRLLAEPAN